MVLTALLLAAAPVLPAPFEALEGTCIVEPCRTAVYAAKGAVKFPKPAKDDGEDVTVGVVTLAANVKKCLVYSPGPSEDPTWLFFGEKSCGPKPPEETPELQLAGEQLIVMGTGVMYVTQNGNAKFSARHKYVLNGKAWKEVKQPFFYVGSSVKVASKTPVTLYAEKKVGADVVVTLAPGASVEVLLAESTTGDWFLVRTEYGLVGWHHSPGGNMEPDSLGISFHGD